MTLNQAQNSPRDKVKAKEALKQRCIVSVPLAERKREGVNCLQLETRWVIRQSSEHDKGRIIGAGSTVPKTIRLDPLMICAELKHKKRF